MTRRVRTATRSSGASGSALRASRGSLHTSRSGRPSSPLRLCRPKRSGFAHATAREQATPSTLRPHSPLAAKYESRSSSRLPLPLASAAALTSSGAPLPLKYESRSSSRPSFDAGLPLPLPLPPSPLPPLLPLPPPPSVVPRSSRTTMLRPSSSDSFRDTTASAASSIVSYVHSPKPRDRPSAPVFTSARTTLPADFMWSFSSFQVTDQDRLPT
mmetsp:Transcript_10957/g.18634  ORF Transcript_10957/g.18634 Transcript_10957/m.18634 type:complete len:214 (-) Transcript_10957:112-753(-)